MTKEERQLLLTDLCGRLPYGVKCQIDFGEPIPGAYVPEGYDRYMDDRIICVYPEDFEFGTNDLDMFSGAEQIKPYLRPMPSMTEEEAKELFSIMFPDNTLFSVEIENDRVRFRSKNKDSEYQQIVLFFQKIYCLEQLDWFNKKHFDYRRLIEKGLALEAPEGMYKTE